MKIEEAANARMDLEAMTDLAITTFYDLAVKYGVLKYPKYGTRNSKSRPKFMKVARICKSRKIPVESFVTAAFTKALERHPMVCAKDICSFDPSNMDTGEQESRKLDATPSDIWNMLSCKLLDMVFSLEGAESKESILDNAMYGFPAWFRVFSPQHPVEEIVFRWGQLAHDELKENLVLESFLKGKRPDTYELLQQVLES